MKEFRYDPPVEALLRKLIGEDRLNKARAELIQEKKNECASGNHDWKQVAYDLQGGKWGKDRCIRCGEEKSWHV